jgi:hypothetical protein
MRGLLPLMPCLLVAAPAAAQDAASAPPVVNEYMSKDIYLPGDPLPLTKVDKIPGADKRRRLSFVACPILVDSEPTPLWLTEYQGETYFLRAQQNLSADVHHPQLLHAVLVEGMVSDEPRIGGGVVLNPLQLSIMRELDPACNEMRPATTGVGVKLAKRPPGPGPSGDRRDQRNIQRIALIKKLEKPRGEYVRDPAAQVEQSFDVEFEFDSDFMYSYPRVTAAVKLFKDMDAERIEVDVYRGSALLDGGRVIVERDDVVDDRIARLFEIFDDYRVERSAIAVTLHREPATPDGIHDFANRHVVLRVKPRPTN